MAIPFSPAVADRPRFATITPVQSLPVTPLTTNVTNTATSATQVTGLTAVVYKIGNFTQYLRVTLSGDNVHNSTTNSVIISLWSGVVGSGTQLGQVTTTASGGDAPISFVFLVPITAALKGTTPTLNIGMHGSGAGTNTLVAASTAPCTMLVELI